MRWTRRLFLPALYALHIWCGSAKEIHPNRVLVNIYRASTDPIAGPMGVKLEDFYWIAEQSQIVADEVCGGGVVSVLEGGCDVS